jgi:anti-sigma-K factor RskA
MTTQELLELCLLDALGLLDEQEHAQFEAAFESASPVVQAHVRREQTRFAKLEPLLPNVEPPAELRARVLARVREANVTTVAMDEPRRLVVPPMLRSRGVSPIWRASTLALSAACITLGGTLLYLQTARQQLRANERTDNLIAALADQFGHAFVQDVLFDRDTQRAVFTPVSQTFDGQATVFVNPEWEKAQFFSRLLMTDPSKKLRLAVVDEQDRVVRVIDTFSTDGRLERHEFAWSPEYASMKLAVLGYDEEARAGSSRETESILAWAELGKPTT